MGKTCVDQECKSGNRGYEKQRVGPKPSYFKIRDEWLQYIPGGDEIIVNEHTRLCSEHFSPDCFQAERLGERKDREQDLTRNLLKPDAIPTIWRGYEWYEEKTVVPRPTKFSTAESRQVPQGNTCGGESPENFFSSLDDIFSKLRENENEFLLVQKDECLIAMSISTEGVVPKIQFGLKISGDLSFDAFCNDAPIKSTELGMKPPFDTKLTSYSLFVSIFQTLSNMYAKVTHKHIRSAIESLKLSNEEEDDTVSFVVEQLDLLTKEPKARRYSPSLLSEAVMLHSISPVCYRHLRGNLILLPCERHVRRLSSAITPDLGLSASTVSYITGRYSKLEDKDKLVGMLMDEVHTKKNVSYTNGQFFGMVNGVITKSLLCVMIRAAAGRYRDVICMSPISNINAEIIRKIYEKCLKVLTTIGFDVVFTMTDGLEANAKFYKMVSSGETMIEHPFDPTKKIVLLFDTVHLFKNLYNNFLSYGVFACPSFKEEGVLLIAKFSHVVELYNLELTLPIKRAHKLTAKMLNPSSVEKTNVKLADACFHESTIAALKYYAAKGHPEFSDTAEVFQIFRDWFNSMNVKSRNMDRRKRDERRASVDKNTLHNVVKYLTKFKSWVEKWVVSDLKGLSRPTFNALTHTTGGFIQLREYLINEKNVEYINSANIQSDCLEGRFRTYRQIHGPNYLCGTLQFLQAEKTLRIRALIDDGFTMKEVKELFGGKQASTSSTDFPYECLAGCKFEDIKLTEEDKSNILYYAGYISRKILQRKPANFCTDCIQMISPGVLTADSQNPHADYALSISRGGLLEPSDLVFTTAQHARFMYGYMKEHPDVEKDLNSGNPRDLFVANFIAKIKEEECSNASIMNAKCKKGHSFEPYVKSIAVAMFNCFAVNAVNEANSAIHEQKKRKVLEEKSTNAKKITKLTSGGSTLKKLPGKEDCGSCKFGKDKKKFGGKGTLKKKCENKMK